MSNKEYIFANLEAALALEAVSQGKKFFSGIKAYIEAESGVNVIPASEAREIVDELLERDLIKLLHKEVPNIYVVTAEGNLLAKEAKQRREHKSK